MRKDELKVILADLELSGDKEVQELLWAMISVQYFTGQ